MTETHRRGEIRLRSNVVLAGDEQARNQAYDLVPGEIVEQYKPHRFEGRASRSGSGKRTATTPRASAADLGTRSGSTAAGSIRPACITQRKPSVLPRVRGTRTPWR